MGNVQPQNPIPSIDDMAVSKYDINAKIYPMMCVIENQLVFEKNPNAPDPETPEPMETDEPSDDTISIKDRILKGHNFFKAGIKGQNSFNKGQNSKKLSISCIYFFPRGLSEIYFQNSGFCMTKWPRRSIIFTYLLFGIVIKFKNFIGYVCF